MKHFNFILYVTAFFAVVSCRCGRGVSASSSAVPSSTQMKYARYLTISENDSCTIVDILNPWKEGNLLHRYILVPRDGTSESWPEGTVIKVPVERMVIYTGVHACIMEELGCINRISGVCEPEYIFSPAIKAMVDSGDICDVGDAFSPDIEKIISLQADIMIVSPFENSGYGTAEKLGIPIVEGADYMENLPLGRTEWLKFFALLVGKETEGDSIFCETEKKYTDLRTKAGAASESKPTILSERKYGSSWGIAGRDSYMATIYMDAGGDYLFDDIPGSGSMKYAFEKVLERGMHADVWLLKYASDHDMTYDELLSECPLYARFDAFWQKHIHACNTLATPYYRDITLHPDRILEDLIHIFHPDLLPDSEDRIRYFRTL